MAEQATRLNDEMQPSPEFALVLACVRWPPHDPERIRHLAQQPIHWPHLLEILHHHKVAPLFHRNLEASAPGAFPLETLRAATVSNAHACLQQSADLFALNRRFREQQIDLRVFKGIPLAIAAYRDPTLRDAGDIDLLVAEKDIFAAEQILLSEGYVRIDPQAPLTPRRLRSYLAHQKDFAYEHPTSGALIDLHWRLYRNAWLPANARLEDLEPAWVDLGSERIPTLTAPSLLLYLCVHGALDGWLRLKWLADIGALCSNMTPQQIQTARIAASAQQALPQFSAAMLLCHDLLGNEIPDGCLARTDRQVARILRFSQRLMRSNQDRPVRELVRGRQWLLNEFQMHSGLRYRVDLAVRSLFRPRVWQRFNLPDALFSLYALLSPLDWCAFHLQRSLTRRLQSMHRSGTRRDEAAPLPRALPLALETVLRRPVADLLLATEAACMLTFFRVALHFIPVQRLTRWMGDRKQLLLQTESPAGAQTLRRVQWAIDAVVRHAPVAFVCFPQSLAAYFMLRRRRIASQLFYGVARHDQQLTAHTWVKVGDRTIVGGEAAPAFTVLNMFP